VVHQPVSRGFAVFADAWLSGWLAEISADLRENGSALEVVLHDYALYKSTFTLLYFTSCLTLHWSLLPIKDIITSQETDQYSKIPMTKSKGKKRRNKKKSLPCLSRVKNYHQFMQDFLLNTLKCHKSYYCSRCLVTEHLEQEHK